MKKFTSILLVLAMLTSAALMASCSNEEATETDAPVSGNEDTVVDETNPAAEETEPAVEETQPEAEETEPAVEETEPVEEVEEDDGFGFLVEQMELLNYKTFVCPYTGGDGVLGGTSGGYFDPETDEMAKFISENPEWYKDTALMSSWDTAEGPFGDRVDVSFAADTDFINDPTNTNGLMVYKSFNIENLSADTLYELYCFYDNTVYIYVNGELFFSADSQCGTVGGDDWNGGFDLIRCNSDAEKTLNDFLVEGENYIAISLKNCWGGRELDFYICYQEGSTKRDVTYFGRGSDWHYSLFDCPYTDGEGTIDGGAAGGYFDEATDEMAKFIAENPDFMTNTELLSSWPVATAPMTNVAEWAGSTHGLICYKTFTVEDLEEAFAADRLVWDANYDNAIHVYLNGVEIYTDDGECVNQDWANGQFTLDAELMAQTLKEGENYIVVTIKDGWGGREFDAGLLAHWD